MGQVFVDDPLTQGHDLRHPRLIVRPQQGGTVGGDEGFALQPRQEGEVRRLDHPAPLGQGDVAAVVLLMEDGLYILPGEGGSGIHVGQQAQGGGALAAGGGGQPGRDDAVLVDARVFQPQPLQLVHQRPGQVPLARGGGGDPRFLRGCGVDLNILQQSFVGSHMAKNFLSF